MRASERGAVTRAGGLRRNWRDYALVASVLGMVTVFGLLVLTRSPASVGLVYLLATILMSLRVGRWPMLLAGLLSALCWDFFFIEPRYTLRIGHVQDALTISIYIAVAIVAGQFAHRIRVQARREKMREESERLQRTLLDSVSHELRTPLSVITAGLESLESADPQRREAVIEEMRTAVRRLNRRVSDLLDQTRLESGMLQPRMDWCDAADLAHSAARAVSDALVDHPFSITIPEDLPPIRADFALTEHALANLILNAAVHTPRATPISIDARLAEDGRACFAVADRGPGLGLAMQGKLFQKFARGDAAQAGGLGLGLSIARGFIAAQGGELIAGDNPGGGVVFSIYLPHSPPQDESPE
jgi:two-component system sensor histidine kinase KdpD